MTKPTHHNELPSADYLAECLDYNEDTGELRWRERPLHHHERPAIIKAWNTNNAGNPAGCVQRLQRASYMVLRLDKVLYMHHRIIWQLVYGAIPPGMTVTHRNGDTLDNRLTNLKLSSHSDNLHGREYRQRGASQYKNVIPCKQRGGYAAIFQRGDVKVSARHTDEETAALFVHFVAEEVVGRKYRPQRDILPLLNNPAKVAAAQQLAAAKLAKLGRGVAA